MFEALSNYWLVVTYGRMGFGWISASGRRDSLSATQKRADAIRTHQWVAADHGCRRSNLAAGSDWMPWEQRSHRARLMKHNRREHVSYSKTTGIHAFLVPQYPPWRGQWKLTWSSGFPGCSRSVALARPQPAHASQIGFGWYCAELREQVFCDTQSNCGKVLFFPRDVLIKGWISLKQRGCKGVQSQATEDIPPSPS